jgi:GNAT superfamily N-acetyltransferase
VHHHKAAATFPEPGPQTRRGGEERPVPRTPTHTRTATVADVPLLVGLWGELRQIGARAERAVNPMTVPDVGVRLAEAIASEECRIALATDGGEPAGMAVFRDLQPDPLSAQRVIQVSHVVVAPGKRRRGVGHALLAAAAEFADERQVEHVVAAVYPSLRDASRFYARLGFAPMLVQRVAPVTVLRRRLGPGHATHGASMPGALSGAMTPDLGLSRVDDLLRRRNRLRRPVPAQRTRIR